MNDKPQINFILRFFFLLLVLIYLVKQDSETCYLDYSNYQEKTYTELIIDLSNEPDFPFLSYSTATYQTYNSPHSYLSSPINKSILKFCVYKFIENLNISCNNPSAQTQILKILQKKNICHQSSENEPAYRLS